MFFEHTSTDCPAMGKWKHLSNSWRKQNKPAYKWNSNGLRMCMFGMKISNCGIFYPVHFKQLLYSGLFLLVAVFPCISIVLTHFKFGGLSVYVLYFQKWHNNQKPKEEFCSCSWDILETNLPLVLNEALYIFLCHLVQFHKGFSDSVDTTLAIAAFSYQNQGLILCLLSSSGPPLKWHFFFI